MTKTSLSFFHALSAFLLCCGLVGSASADQVINWNRVASDVLLTDTASQNPGFASRTMAMVNLAMYDSINGISPTHQQFYSQPIAPIGADSGAAAAQAARDVLVNIYPAQQAMVDAELNTVLNAIPNSQSKTDAIGYGSSVAANVLSARMNDGFNNMVAYSPSGQIGDWEPDLLNPGQVAWGPQWGQVTTFGTNNAAQFLPPAMPSLTSQAYTDAYDEVKSLGELNSTTRTADQTEVAYFWAYDRLGMGTPMRMYNKIMRDVAVQEGNSMQDNARLFAMATTAVVDTGISAWDSKFTYDFWRPISGIRKGDLDGNPDTQVDVNWTPLGAPGDGNTIDDFTPPFPTYVSGHASFGAAMFKSMELFYGTDNISFSVTSEEMPGVTRSYTSLSEAMEENGRSRVYLGIHWDFDDLVARDLGNDVADYVHTTHFAPVPEPSGVVLMLLGLVAVFRRRR